MLQNHLAVDHEQSKCTFKSDGLSRLVKLHCKTKLLIIGRTIIFVYYYRCFDVLKENLWRFLLLSWCSHKTLVFFFKCISQFWCRKIGKWASRIDISHEPFCCFFKLANCLALVIEN